MILPKGNNSKYIKVVIGIFVLFTIISPITGNFVRKKNGVDLESYLDDTSDKTIQTNVNFNNDQLIRQMYEENLKIDIKAKIQQKGYMVGDLNVEILDNQEYTLNSINITIVGNSQNKSNNKQTSTIVENVENILINVSKSNSNQSKKEKSVISESEKRKLIQYLSGVYEVKESHIFVY